MSRTEATRALLIEGLCAAVAFEFQPVDPKVMWKHLTGLGLVAAGGNSLPAPGLNSTPSRVPKFFDLLTEMLAVDPDTGLDDWLNSDAPLTCGAVHDLLDHILSEVPSSQWRGHGRKWWDYSNVLRHVADTGEPIAQARPGRGWLGPARGFAWLPSFPAVVSQSRGRLHTSALSQRIPFEHEKHSALPSVFGVLTGSHENSLWI